MAYRNTIISIATLVAFGTACSKAPNYSSGVQKDAGQVNAVVNDDPGHGPDPVVTGNAADAKPAGETPTTPTPEAAKPAAPAAPGTPAALTDAEKAKAMNTKGFIVYAVSADDGAGWNTAATPFIIAPTVNAAGAVDTAKPFEAIFCNFRGANLNMQLHSGTGNGPTAHGNGIAGAALPAGKTLADVQADLNKLATSADVLAGNANCATNRISALGTAAGATYNHRGGNANQQASYVYFKMFTVDAAGVVAAK